MQDTQHRMDVDTKRCSDCDAEIDTSLFGSNRTTKDGLTVYCREHHRQRMYDWRRANPAKHKESKRTSDLKHRYGLTREGLAVLLDAQGGRCAICGGWLAGGYTVDHDHACCPDRKSCGKCVRGLLCSPCNTMLGMANDEPDRLLAAADYLRRVRG